MLKIAALGVFLTMGLSSPLRAMETDNFTGRSLPIKDSLVALDVFTNEKLQQAVDLANEDEDLHCDAKSLFKELDHKLGATPIGQVERWANKSPLIERLPLKGDGIYTGFKFFSYPMTYLSGIAPSIRLDGHVVGTDKLGHFMSEGGDYFKMIYQKKKTIEQAMTWGISTEESYFGLGVSGVKSYADLAANYAGLTFWRQVTGGLTPYFECKGSRWVQVRNFTWHDYVTDAWDEGINCSEFSPKVKATVATALEKLGMTCPVAGSVGACRALARLPDSAWYLNPICLLQ